MDSITFKIRDTGKGFDPSQIKQEELESLIAKRKDGGLGMRLIKTLMDEVQYEIGPGQKNELRMTKLLPKVFGPKPSGPILRQDVRGYVPLLVSVAKVCLCK